MGRKRCRPCDDRVINIETRVWRHLLARDQRHALKVTRHRGYNAVAAPHAARDVSVVLVPNQAPTAGVEP